MSEFLLKNVQRMRHALDHHNRSCGDLALAFRLNPVDHGLLGFDVLWGVPVRADDRVGVKEFRLSCLSNEREFEEECDAFAVRSYALAPV